MTKPYTSPTAPSSLSEKKLRSFQVVRAIAIGMGGAGALLACLRFFIALTEPIAARCEILGGMLLFFAGALLLIGFFAKRGGAHARANIVTLAIAIGFCLSGCGWLSYGYTKEAAHRKRLDDCKSNLNAVGDALDAYEQRQGNPAGNAP